MSIPVLLVHGIWDDGARFDRMRAALERAGRGPVLAIDLSPNDGSAPVEQMAAQVERAVEGLREETREARVDVVGFSMGALVSRYWLQRHDGQARTRRYVSISGPHEGTATAWALPLAGVRQMRPGSALLRDLAADADPWGDAEAHAVWTPWDLMILPATSSRLPRLTSEHRLPVKMHRWMITDPRAIGAVVEILKRG